jgi:4-amino-4-deoxy-L-arabinose transferase-like glycosyltransferase
LRRADARSGWLVAVGGAFAVTAVAFSTAKGIFHPYYVSQLAPLTAALVGAGAGEIARGGPDVRLLGALAVIGGVVAELLILRDNPGTLDWLPGLLVAAGAAAAALLAGGATGRLRAGVVAALLAVLLIGPATWAVQTLGHATSGTFPAGGPATIGFGGPGGGPGAGGAAGAGAGAPGGSFGGDSSVAAALAYARAHGGGTVAVSSQNGAAQEVSAGQGVVALGGFSGRETQVSLRWLDQAPSGRGSGARRRPRRANTHVRSAM